MQSPSKLDSLCSSKKINFTSQLPNMKSYVEEYGDQKNSLIERAYIRLEKTSTPPHQSCQEIPVISSKNSSEEESSGEEKLFEERERINTEGDFLTVNGIVNSPDYNERNPKNGRSKTKMFAKIEKIEKDFIQKQHDFHKNRRLSFYLQKDSKKRTPDIILFFSFILVVIRLQRIWMRKKIGEKSKNLRRLLFSQGVEEGFDETLAHFSLANNELHSHLMKRDHVFDSYYLELEVRSTLKGIVHETNMLNEHGIKKTAILISRFIQFIALNIVNSILFNFIMACLLIYYNFLLVEYSFKNNRKEFIEEWIKVALNLLLYSFYLENLLQMMAYGILIPRNSYFKRRLCRLDFLILVLSYIVKEHLSSGTLDLVPFRVFLLMRYIKIRHFLNIINSLDSSLGSLTQTLTVVFFIYLFFSLSAVRMFSDVMRNQCFYPDTGIPLTKAFWCGNLECPEGLICGKMITNPEDDATHFDDVLYSLMQILRISTLNNWTYVMYLLHRTFSEYTLVYFLALIFIGNYFAINLIVCVIKLKYTETLNELTSEKRSDEINKNKERFNLKLMRISGAYMKYGRDLNSLKNQATHIPEFELKQRDIEKELQTSAKTSNTTDFTRLTKFENFLSSKIVDPLITLFKICWSRYSRLFIIHYEEKKKHIPYLRPIVVDNQDFIFNSEKDVLEEKESLKNIELKKLKTKGKVEKNYSGMDFYRTYKKILKNRLANKAHPILSPLISKIAFWNISHNLELQYREKKEKKKKLPLLIRTYNHHYSGYVHFKSSNPFADIKKEFATLKKAITSHIQRVFLQDNNKYLLKESVEEINNNYEEKISKEKTIKKKYNEILKDSQIKSGSKVLYRNWSGKNVLPKATLKQQVLTFNRIRPQESYYFFDGVKKLKLFIRYLCQQIEQNYYFMFICLATIFANTLILSCQGLLEDELIDNITRYFFCLFFFQFLVKLGSLTVKGYLKDPLHIMDLSINLFQIIDIMLYNIKPSLIENNYFYNLFQCLIVFRFLHLSRSIQFTNTIISLIKKTWISYLSIGFLLIVLMMVYAVIGVQIFSGTFSMSTLEGHMKNFETYQSAVMTVFNVVTIDNWFLLYVKANLYVGIYKSLFFFYTLIIVGNFIFLRLFVATMLDGFEQVNLVHDNNKKTIRYYDSGEDEEEYKRKEKSEKTRVDEIEDTMKLRNNRKTYLKNMFLLENFKHITEGHASESNSNSKNPVDIEFSDKNLYFFSHESGVRKFCNMAITHRLYDKVMYFTVLVGTVRLALETFYDWDNTEPEFETMKKISMVFSFIETIIYTIDFYFKSIAKGFIFPKGAYLRNVQNFLDFTTLIAFYVSLQINNADYPALRAFMLLRIFRPLRILYRNTRTSAMLNSLLESLSPMFQVVIVLFIIWLVFAILGVMLFRGRFGYCDEPVNFYVGKTQCLEENGKWIVFRYNFENVFQASMVLFIFTTLDNWAEIFIIAVNSNNENQGPIFMKSQVQAYIYFSAFIVIVVLFFINMFLAVIFTNFTEAQKKKKHPFLTDDQVRWIEIQKVLIESKPYQFEAPKSPIKKFAWSVITSASFQGYIFVIMVIDNLQEALPYKGASKTYTDNLNRMGYLVTITYISETILKIYSYGFSKYMSYILYKYEFLITLVYTIIFFIENYAENFFLGLPYGSRIIALIYVFRIVSMFRLIERVKHLRNFFINVWFSLPLVFNIVTLILIIFFMFGVLGNFLFRNVRTGEIIDYYINFENFLRGMLALLRACNSNDWQRIMDDVAKHEPDCIKGVDCGSKWAPLYFIIFMIVTNYLLMNLFILIIYQQFEGFFISKLCPVEFISKIETFKRAWLIFPNKRGDAIHVSKLVNFFKQIGPPLGFEEKEDFKSVGLKLVNMDVYYDDLGFTSFENLLYTTIKCSIREDVFVNIDHRSGKLLREVERKYIKFLRLGKLDETRNTKKQRNSETMKVIHNIGGKNNLSSPIFFIMINLMIFKTWKSFAIKNQAYVTQMIMKKHKKRKPVQINSLTDFHTLLLNEQTNKNRQSERAKSSLSNSILFKPFMNLLKASSIRVRPSEIVKVDSIK